MPVIHMRQFSGSIEGDKDLEETEAHQPRAQRNGRVDNPGRPLQIRRDRPFKEVARVHAEILKPCIFQTVRKNKVCAKVTNHPGK